MPSATLFLLVVTLAVAAVADNPYRYADLHAARVQRFDELYGKRAPQVLPRNETDGLYGWQPDSPYISTPADQGACGSCYGFAAMHTVTDLMATTTSTPPKNISVQFALACSPTHATLGYCYGGDPSSTSNFMLSFLRNKGYPSESCDPYKPYKKLNEPSCSTTCSNNPRDTFFELSQPSLKVPVLLNQNVEAMVEALKTGPLLAVIQVNDDFQAWGQSESSKTQVYTPNADCQTANHAVEIIGYVNSTDTPYWIVKNSWGTTWADNGVVYVAAGNDPLCLESQIPMSDGSWYKAVKDFPNFMSPFDYIAVDDPTVVAGVNFFVAEINNSTCNPVVVEAQEQVVQGYNLRLQVTTLCPSEEPKEYLVALTWDLSTKTFSLVGLEVLDEVTPYVPEPEEAITSGASTLHSAFFALF